MVDWPGLLKWSLAQTDSTHPSQLSPMDPDTRQWLRKALESFAFHEKAKLQRISAVLSTAETGSDPEERKLKEDILQELMSIIDNPELARCFVNSGGVLHLVKCMLGSRYTTVRRLASLIFSSAAQNNPAVQSYAYEQGVLEGLIEAVREETDVGAKESYVSSLSALVRGEYEAARRDFIESRGLEVLRDVILCPVSLRIVKKSLLLLGNLFYYDHIQVDLQILEQALELGFVTVLLSMESHEDLEVRQMALQALHNLGKRSGPNTQQITEGLEGWIRRLRLKPERAEELSAFEEILHIGIS